MTRTEADRSAPGRREDHRFVKGTGRYTDDLSVPGELQAWFVRSDFASCTVSAVETRAALEVPGVVAIFTAADLEREGIAGISASPALPRDDGGRAFCPVRPLLCARVAAVGEPVAMVVAESMTAARDAAELVEVTAEEAPALVTAAQALSPDAPLVWSAAADNVAFVRRFGDADAVETAMVASAHVVRLEMEISRVTAVAMEPRAALAIPLEGGRVELVTGTQNPPVARAGLARTLGLDPALLRVRSEDIGGSFGMKNGLYREDMLVVWAARRLGRPVCWSPDRRESFLSDDHGRDVRIIGELALDSEGRFTALRARMAVNVGAYSSRRSTGAASNIGGIAGVYRIPAIFAEVRGAFTNTGVIGPYRGNGRTEATYVVERLIDSAAREMGLDSLELRQRNLVGPEQMPWRTALGTTYDCGDFRATLARATGLADWPGFAARRQAAEARGRLRGIGLAMPIETAGGPATGPRPDCAVVRVRPDGGIAIATGTVSSGQGHETVMPRLVASVLGVSPEEVAYGQADTALLADGRGAGGSGGAPVSVVAMFEAARAAKARLVELAAMLFGADPADVELSGGLLRLKSSNRTARLTEVAALADSVEGVVVRHDFTPPGATFPNGCHVAEVEVDARTGAVLLVNYSAVEDVGTVLDQALVEGQMHGGIVQGIGQALDEALRYDETGQLLTASFMDYAMPRATDLPEFRLELLSVQTQMNSLGVKGVGEAGTVGALSAVMNAVNNALASAGAGPVEMPATPARVWEALRRAGGVCPPK